MPRIIITAKKDGFRRCGVAHSKEPQTYEDGKWTTKQLAVLKDEPMLVVQEVADLPEVKDKKEPARKEAK